MTKVEHGTSPYSLAWGRGFNLTIRDRSWLLQKFHPEADRKTPDLSKAPKRSPNPHDSNVIGKYGPCVNGFPELMRALGFPPTLSKGVATSSHSLLQATLEVTNPLVLYLFL